MEKTFSEKIDVTICTLNSDHKISECIESVIQYLPVRKIIIVDGGSNDKTIIKAQKFGDIVEIHIRADLNLGKSREYAFKQVKTKWFLQLDSDVVLSSNIKDVLCRYVNKGDVVEFGTVNHWKFTYPTEADLNSNSFKRRGFFIVNLIKREAIENVSIDTHTMEEELTRRLIERNGRVWCKTGEIVGDHFSQPVRHEGRCAVSLVRSKPIHLWEFYEHGRVLRLSGVSLKVLFKDVFSIIIQSLNMGAFLVAYKGVRNPFLSLWHFLRGLVE